MSAYGGSSSVCGGLQFFTGVCGPFAGGCSPVVGACGDLRGILGKFVLNTKQLQAELENEVAYKKRVGG